MTMKRSIAALFTFTSAAVLAHATNAGFDTWADDFAARYVRQNPQLATRSQYFSGAEQDALDRQLTLSGSYGGTIGVKGAQEAAALAREGLAGLAKFPEATLS